MTLSVLSLCATLAVSLNATNKAGLPQLGFNIAQTDGEPLPMPATTNEWGAFVSLKGTQCMDGKETGVFLRKGTDPSKLAIFFQGGGACFNTLTCGLAQKNAQGTGTSDKGVFDANDKRNPFRDHSWVMIPYCTGDIFLGTKEGNVGGKKQFMGRTNLNLLMQRLVPTFPDIKSIVLTGQSAGGIGAFANFDFVVQGWLGRTGNSLKDLVVINDCGPIFTDEYLAPCLQTLWRDLWGITPSLPADCPQCTGEDGGGVVNYYEFIQNKYPTAKFGMIESAQDSVISLFFGFGNNDCTDKVPAVLNNGPKFEKGLIVVSDNYLGDRFGSLFFEGSMHTYINTDAYYTASQAGVFIYDWANEILEGKFPKINPWDDVHSYNTSYTAICKDEVTGCEKYASQGLCSHSSYEAIMAQQCQKTCLYCTK